LNRRIRHRGSESPPALATTRMHLVAIPEGLLCGSAVGHSRCLGLSRGQSGSARGVPKTSGIDARIVVSGDLTRWSCGSQAARERMGQDSHCRCRIRFFAGCRRLWKTSNRGRSTTLPRRIPAKFSVTLWRVSSGSIGSQAYGFCEPGELHSGRPGGGKLLYRVTTSVRSASMSQSEGYRAGA